MRDQILSDHLRQWLESNPSKGLEKLIESEMQSLCETISEIAFDIYQRGYSEGFDDAHIVEGVKQ